MRRATWAVVTPVLWALGWLITSQVIVDVDAQYATFGASGALVATLSWAVSCSRSVRHDTNPSTGVVGAGRSLSGVR